MRLSTILLLLSLYFFNSPFQLTAQENGRSQVLNSDSVNVAGEENEHPDKGRKRVSFTGFPVILYMPETSMIFGGGATVTIRNRSTNVNDRPNTVNFHAIYTLKKQVALSLSPVFYFNDFKWKVRPVLAYQKFPDVFYGIGNNNTENDAEGYTTEDFLFNASLTRVVYRELRLGGSFELQKTNVLKIAEGGLLSEGGFKGIDGSAIAGFGPVIEWDNRDNIFYPARGLWMQFYATFYRKWLGSGYDYDSYTADLRYYFSIMKTHVIAVQLLARTRAGEFPFNEYARLEAMRGVNGSRFRDRTMVLGQVEYRYPIYKRISGVAFGAVGDVAGNLRDYEIKNLKFSFGVGVRYLVNPKEKINFRFDIGFSPWGFSPYFQITEAF